MVAPERASRATTRCRLFFFTATLVCLFFTLKRDVLGLKPGLRFIGQPQLEPKNNFKKNNLEVGKIIHHDLEEGSLVVKKHQKFCCESASFPRLGKENLVQLRKATEVGVIFNKN